MRGENIGLDSVNGHHVRFIGRQQAADLFLSGEAELIEGRYRSDGARVKFNISDKRARALVEAGELIPVRVRMKKALRMREEDPATITLREMEVLAGLHGKPNDPGLTEFDRRAVAREYGRVVKKVAQFEPASFSDVIVQRSIGE
jgi:hypothetical protein